jgi:branched-chain amino acid transport system permease protein
MMPRSPAQRLWLGLVIVAVSTAIPLIFGFSSYIHYIVEMIMIYLLAATGLNVAMGFAGQFQMAQGAIIAVTAYGAAIFSQELHWPLAAAIGVGILFGMGLTGLVALLSARLTSHYLLLASFGLQVITIGLIPEIPLTGGHYGRNAVTSFPLFGWNLSGTTPAYTAALILIAGLGVLASDWLKRSYLGIGLQAARQNERVVNASGVSSNKLKLVAVLISGAFAAVAGVLVGPVQTFLVPASFGTELTLLLLIMVIFGGAGSVAGVLISTVALTIASQVAQSETTAWPLIYGLFVMVLLTLTQKGIGGSLELLKSLVPSAATDARAAVGRPGPAPVKPVAAFEAATALSVERANRNFGGVTALADVTVSVPAGALHGLVGPNGSGKTTLFEVVSGFVRLDRGSVRAFGHDIVSLTPAGRCRIGIARSFQHPTVLRDSLVIENVLVGVLQSIPLRQRLRPADERAPREWVARASAALDLVGLRHLQFERAASLSYGQRKLVDLARVVASSPSLALLDEPLAGIGESSAYVRKVIDFLRESGCAILLVEHNMQFIMDTCDQVTVLNTGRIIASGDRHTVLNDPEVLACYLGPGVHTGSELAAEPLRTLASG